MLSNTKPNPYIEKMDHISTEMIRLLNKRNEEELPFKPTSAKFILLHTLFKKGRCMVNDLSTKTNLTSGATTLALNRLEKDGIVQRTRDSHDRRVVWVELSEHGSALVQQLLLRRQQAWEKMLQALSEQEQEIFIQLMEKIHDEMKRSNDSASFLD
ncbi:MarR family winged helix-turn-helix transcriptional regulator [Desmospora activa]|uniref:DNA-binding MarR family transcriptional regulator n=1 Tax=Desmospora activa DSM 45169 TaxID=1121389 RepID=A0A2T4Z0C6_9BACL|nr:MarR family transcriptional regulator [Desmospora activa]PTM53198.1 DNA-binding MarR family transcriptional regulator [Desmospora activa DSM 45169]